MPVRHFAWQTVYGKNDMQSILIMISSEFLKVKFANVIIKAFNERASTSALTPT